MGALEVIPGTFPIPADRRPWRLYPTDISQFVRLNQCQRFLRLRLAEQQNGLVEFRACGATPQTLPPMLAESGRMFEEGIERQAAEAGFPTVDCTTLEPGNERGPHNDYVVERAAGLAPGETLVLFQPGLRVRIGHWAISGVADVIRLDRGPDGTLSMLIVDIKASPAARVEHRLQVAFYQEMAERLLAAAGITDATVATGVLYRGLGLDEDALDEQTLRERDEATRLLGVSDGFLEVVDDPWTFQAIVREMVTGPGSLADRVAEMPFDEVPFSIGSHCDRCVYNEFCMRWIDQHDDLAVLPFITDQERRGLVRAGVTTVSDLARLKVPGNGPGGASDMRHLLPAPGEEGAVRRVAANWAVGPRLDELIHRAWSYRRSKGDHYEIRRNIPSKGHGSLPFVSADHHPNLVRVFIEAQQDYVQGRLYMLGGLVSCAEDGVFVPERRRIVVECTDGPPSEQDEEDLLVRWIGRAVAAVVDLAAPDEAGERRAPIHLIFSTATDQRNLLAALARHGEKVIGSTALYDFMTQRAAFDSPVLSFLDREVRDLKNIPIVCQSLPIVSERLGFRWNEPEPFREWFRTRQFDYWLHDPDGVDAATKASWYIGRARFSGQIPVEYAYGAWGLLPKPEKGQDLGKPYRQVTLDQLERFQARRLEAMEHVASEFRGNPDTTKTSFDLPDLSNFADRAGSMAEALDEFLMIERHVSLGAWKKARLAPPERRVLSGETLLVEYRAEDQTPEVAAQNAANQATYADRLVLINQRFGTGCTGDDCLDKEERKQLKIVPPDGPVRLRLTGEGVDATVEKIAEMNRFRPGDTLIVSPRWTTDGRLPPDERVPLMPSAKQLLYGMRAQVVEPGVAVAEDGSGWFVSVNVQEQRGGFPPWVYGAMRQFPFDPGTLYTLDSDPNNWNEYWAAKVVEGLRAGKPSVLFERLQERDVAPPLPRSPEEIAVQQRFMDGLCAFAELGEAHEYEPQKQEFIGGRGDDPILLVQGPPGTGKSTTSGFAILARAQGAMAVGRPFRVLLSCKTHAATDVLLESVKEAQDALLRMRRADPALFARYFDDRLLNLPLFRLKPRGTPAEGIAPLPLKGSHKELTTPFKVLDGHEAAVVAGTPGSVWQAAKEAAKDPFGLDRVDLLVLDEASQMNLPEALMASLPLKADGQVIVVGDHRQMPPIVQHAWEGEPRKSFEDYKVYESLFDLLRAKLDAPIQFSESFRLHREIAEYLRREVYRHDGIDYHSRRVWTVSAGEEADDYVRSVLNPGHPIVVIVHDEEESQQANLTEQALVAPLVEALIGRGYDFREGVGVVVPHRAQRAEIGQRLRGIAGDDPALEVLAVSAVDTVERFQGGEREVVIISATESDPSYLLASGKFLYDPRRLTVALSRAKQKLVLVAARSVFRLFSPDEEIFGKALMWRNLVERTCVVPLWQGEVAGAQVEVFGNLPCFDD